MMHSGASGSAGWLLLAGILALGVLAAVGAVLATRDSNGRTGWLAVVVGSVVGLTGLALAAQAYATTGMPMARHASFTTARSVPSCTSSPPAAGQTVEVVATDMSRMRMRAGRHRMTLTADTGSVAAGSVTLVLRNAGMMTHELVVLPLADGQQPGQRPVAADGTVDESRCDRRGVQRLRVR